MAATMKGAISFGLLHVPISLHTATQDNDIHFNQLCREDGSRVKYKKVCSKCGKEVSAQDIVKGFEIEDGKYVTLTDEDFEKAKVQKDKTIHILHFAASTISGRFTSTRPTTSYRKQAATKPMSCCGGV